MIAVDCGKVGDVFVPLYFFDLRNSEDAVVIRDVQGYDLPDIDCAVIEAVETWKAFKPADGSDRSAWRIEIADPDGTVVAVTPKPEAQCPMIVPRHP